MISFTCPVIAFTPLIIVTTAVAVPAPPAKPSVPISPENAASVRQIGENFRSRGAFGEARKDGLQHHPCPFQDRLASDNLRVSDDALLVVHG